MILNLYYTTFNKGNKKTLVIYDKKNLFKSIAAFLVNYIKANYRNYKETIIYV